MKSKLFGVTLCFLLVITVCGNAFGDETEYPIMPAEAWEEAIKAAEAAPKAGISGDIQIMLNQAKALNYSTSLDFLDRIDYDPAQRNQGNCGNCWVWAGTGVMEITHDKDDGVFDRLSIQYLDSCRTDWACCGGGLGGFATWYSGQGLAVPWHNTNASFADAGRNCQSGGSLVPCGTFRQRRIIPSIPSHK